jgi:hypothetical protein
MPTPYDKQVIYLVAVYLGSFLHRSIAGVSNNRAQMICDAFELIGLTKKPAAALYILRLALCVTRGDD